MRGIRYLLLAMLVFALWLYLCFFRSRSRDRLLVFAGFTTAASFILAPSWSSMLASLVGVGRGVDLVIYLALMLLAFISLVLYSQLREVKGQLTALARDAAIQAARKPIPTVGNGPLEGFDPRASRSP